MRVLRQGFKGKDVKKIQTFLKSQNFYLATVSGVFDAATNQAVRAYQTYNYLVSDGIVGMKTINSMRGKGFVDEDRKFHREFNLTENDVYDIIMANNHQLICEPNKNNPEPTSFDPESHLIVVAIRGYKLKMGRDGYNDRRIYDDAHFIWTPRGMHSFEANTDPNGWRKGSGYGRGKGMAMLDNGVWFFGRGRHKGRPAFRQACPFRVIRDGNPPYAHTGYHAINWHDGGESTTSSLGCQTNKPHDFRVLRELIYSGIEEYKNPKMYLDYKSGGQARALPYILINETDRRKGKLDV